MLVYNKVYNKVYNIVDGGLDRDRTGDLLVANETLSQLSYSPSALDNIKLE